VTEEPDSDYFAEHERLALLAIAAADRREFTVLTEIAEEAGNQGLLLYLAITLGEERADERARLQRTPASRRVGERDRRRRDSPATDDSTTSSAHETHSGMNKAGRE
jgi:hypothetical protein